MSKNHAGAGRGTTIRGLGAPPRITKALNGMRRSHGWTPSSVCLAAGQPSGCGAQSSQLPCIPAPPSRKSRSRPPR